MLNIHLIDFLGSFCETFSTGSPNHKTLYSSRPIETRHFTLTYNKEKC